jgi:uncharacterized protein (UPF0254 family)
MSVDNKRVKMTLNRNDQKEIMKIIKMISDKMATLIKAEIIKQKQKNGIKLNF